MWIIGVNDKVLRSYIFLHPGPHQLACPHYIPDSLPPKVVVWVNTTLSDVPSGYDTEKMR